MVTNGIAIGIVARAIRDLMTNGTRAGGLFDVSLHIENGATGAMSTGIFEKRGDLLWLLLAILAVAVEPSPTWASEAIADWTLKCGAEIGPLPTARQIPECVIDQTASNGSITLRAIAGGVTSSGAPAVIFDISPPVSVEGGLGLKVDGRILGASWIENCTETSCESEVLLDEQFLRAFKRGRAASIRVRDLNDQQQTISLSLMGFTRAFDKLGYE